MAGEWHGTVEPQRSETTRSIREARIAAVARGQKHLIRGRHASENDADRDQLLSIAGWKVVHLTREQILDRGECGRRLVALTTGA